MEETSSKIARKKVDIVMTKNIFWQGINGADECVILKEDLLRWGKQSQNKVFLVLIIEDKVIGNGMIYYC